MPASGRIALKGSDPDLKLKSGSDPDFLKTLRPAWIPAGILLATALLAWRVPLPPSLAGLRTAGPYALLLTGLGMALRFNRGRAFVILASLLGGFAAVQAFPGKGVHTAVALLVPLNALLAMIYPERGVRFRAAYGWLALLGLEAALLAWLPGVSLPALLGRLMFAAAFAAAVWRAWPELAPLQVLGGRGVRQRAIERVDARGERAREDAFAE